MSLPDEHIRMENPTTGDLIDFPKPVTVNNVNGANFNGAVSIYYEDNAQGGRGQRDRLRITRKTPHYSPADEPAVACLFALAISFLAPSSIWRTASSAVSS